MEQGVFPMLAQLRLERLVAARRERVLCAICDQPYGCRDFDIEDCNAYRLCFGQDIE